MKKFLVVVTLVAALFPLVLSGCVPGARSQSGSSGRTNAAPLVRYARVVRGDITESVSELGSLEPLDRVEVTLVEAVAEGGGKIRRILVQEGDLVEREQPLIELDTEDLEISRLRAEASLQSARAELAKVLARPTEVELRQKESQYEQARVAYENARKNLERNRTLIASGAISREVLESSEQEVILAERALKAVEAELQELHRLPREEDVAIARSAVTRAEADLRSIEKKIRASTITSPISGTVVKINVREEEMVSTKEVLVVVADLRTMKAVVPVNEVDITRVKPGQKAVVRLDALPDREFEGTVVSTSQQESIQDNVVTYHTIIHLDNSEGLLRSGMTVDASIIIATKDNVLLVPAEALMEEGRETFVMLRKGENETEKRPVRVGLRSDTMVEILEGLQEGNEVVIALRRISAAQRPMGGPPEGP